MLFSNNNLKLFVAEIADYDLFKVEVNALFIRSMKFSQVSKGTMRSYCRREDF